ncbi:MAG: cytochrome C assembly protein [Chloroflexota bacterium]|nr:MAG: cytochrome C assembly protein [Chloroflexota bacterium]
MIQTTIGQNERRDRRGVNLLGYTALAGILVALYAVFFYAPREAMMGEVQRIFYFHVPSAYIAFLAFAVVFVSSVQYLRTRDAGWDARAHASAEIGVVFCTIALVTGSIWAKPIWGAWWTWDPRLTTTLVLWLIYVSYLMLRRALDEPERRARFAAVVGIIGFVDVPLVFMSIRWWRTIHPVVFNADSIDVDGQMMVALVVSLAAFTILYLYLLKLRVGLERLQIRVEALQRARW